eukprot:8291117-Alexandrium_andersonii.AAC.1
MEPGGMRQGARPGHTLGTWQGRGHAQGSAWRSPATLAVGQTLGAAGENLTGARPTLRGERSALCPCGAAALAI